jgi:molybdopterin converting factor small subunit
MVQVEFYGVPRLRSGVGQLELDGVTTLGEALTVLAERCPGLQQDCLWPNEAGGWMLSPHYAANLGGRAFIRDPRYPLAAGDVLLILSADAGG